MSQVINTNIASLNAQRNLNASQSQLNVSLERLSSGLRINSAKDDAAGLAISERFTAQINGNNQAVRNANDGISLAQTAEGALEEIGNIGQRIRELAVQAANDTNSASDREALNNEVEQLIAEAGRIAQATQFNDQSVLDGSLEEILFQVGANRGQTISVDGVDARTDQLGANVTESSAVNSEALAGLAATGFTINGEDIDLSGVSSVADVVDAINESSGDTGVEAVRVTAGDVIGNTGLNDAEIDVQATNATEAADPIMTINGVDIEMDGTTNVTTVDDLVGRINAFSDDSGVTASNEGGNLVLNSTGSIEITNVDDGSRGAGDGIGGDGDVFGSGNADVTFELGFELSTDLGEPITLGDTDGNNEVALNLGLTQNDEDDNSLLDATEFSMEGISILTRDEAADTIRTMDFVLGQVNSLRADLGAVQNRFESTVANLSVTSENLEASRSRILDADFAAETAALTRGQILQQAGTSVLAQANQLPNNVLALLQ